MEDEVAAGGSEEIDFLDSSRGQRLMDLADALHEAVRMAEDLYAPKVKANPTPPDCDF